MAFLNAGQLLLDTGGGYRAPDVASIDITKKIQCPTARDETPVDLPDESLVLRAVGIEGNGELAGTLVIELPLLILNVIGQTSLRDSLDMSVSGLVVSGDHVENELRVAT